MLEKSISLWSRNVSPWYRRTKNKTKGTVMNKVNSGYASTGRVKRGGIFAFGFMLLGLLLLPAQTGWADPTPTLTVTRSIGQNAFRADAYSDLGSGYAAGETLQVTLTVTASEAVTLEGFQIAEKVPSGWSLTEAESGDFIYKSQGDIYNLIIKPSFFTDNESWLTFAAGQGKPLTYKVKPDSASHAAFPLAAFSTSNLNNGTIAETEVSGYAIFGPDLGENGVLSRDKDKVTLDYDVPEGAIVHEWRSADQAGSLLGIGNPLVKNLAGSLTVADPVLAYRVNLTNLVGTQIPAAAVPAVTSKLLEVEGMYYAIPGDTVSLDVAAPQGTFFKDAFRDNVEPEDNFTTPALSGTFVVGTGENAVEYTCWQFTMPAEVVNIEAICAPKYTLTFADIQIGDYFAGDAINTAAIPNYTPPATMVLTGYDAPEGWGEDIDFSCDLDSVPCTISIPQMPAENVTITPIFRGVSILRQVYASPYPVYQAGETTDIAYWLYVPEELWQKNPLITIEDILPTAWDIDETEKSPDDWTLLAGDNQLQVTFTAQVDSQSDGFDSFTGEQFFVYDRSDMLNPGTAGRLFALVWQVTPRSSAVSDELAKKSD